MIAWPLVEFISRVRRPIRPRAGMVNSTCVSSLRVSIFRHSPRRLPTSSITGPIDVDGTSTTRYSIGSCVLPLTSLVSTCGLPTDSSYPSRRMFSSRMPRCKMPRPATWNSSRFTSSSRTRRATFDSSSFIRRSRSWRLVTYCPSCPAKGESLMRKIISSVGSSTVIGGRATAFSKSAMVSPI